MLLCNTSKNCLSPCILARRYDVICMPDNTQVILMFLNFDDCHLIVDFGDAFFLIFCLLLSIRYDLPFNSALSVNGEGWFMKLPGTSASVVKE